MAIIDSFLYNGERECLDIRLHELAGVVDHHIALEAAETFTGQPRPWALVRGFPTVARYRVHGHLPTSDPWLRETHQRNAIVDALDEIETLADDDIILMGDADEIPSAEAVQVAVKLAAMGQQVAFDQTLCTYYVNVVCKNMRWRGTQAIRYDKLKTYTPQGVRDLRHHAPYVSDGGWHFSSVMSAEKIREKLQSFSHTECNRPEYTNLDHIRRCMAECKDVTGRTDVQFAVNMDARLPSYIVENVDRFTHLFYPGTADKWLRRLSTRYEPQYAGQSTD